MCFRVTKAVRSTLAAAVTVAIEVYCPGAIHWILVVTADHKED
jgi:hypothetical protein